MIRILVQYFEGKNTKENYIASYQFRVTERIEDELALDILLDWLRTSKILIESEHKDKM